MALWFRYAFQAIATTVAVLPKRGWALLRTAHPKFQCLRGVLLLTTSVFAFFSLKYMPVGEFTAIVMITPLVITLLASLTLGERVSILRWALVIGGFVGTLIIIRPGSDSFNWTLLLPLGLVASHAWFQILTSRLAAHARSTDDVNLALLAAQLPTRAVNLRPGVHHGPRPDAGPALRVHVHHGHPRREAEQDGVTNSIPGVQVPRRRPS